VIDLSDRVGQELGVGEWMEIAQDRVDAFAVATDDHQWIHEAGERAAAGPFGGPIAHGFLTLSLLTPLTGGVLRPYTAGVRMAINYGLDRVRFITPVRVGSRIRGRVKLVEAKSIDGGVQLKVETTIEIEGADRPAAVVESLVRLYG
jgi:acyl dehydratase